MSAHMDVIAEFSALAAQHSLTIDNIVPSGSMERFTDRARGDHNPNGYYVLHISPDGRYAWGCFGHWSLKSGRVEHPFYWYGPDPDKVSDVEKRKINLLIKASQRDIRDKLNVDKKQALAEIAEIWRSSRRIESDVKHDYLINKKIPAVGIRYLIDDAGKIRLVIPIITGFKKRELKSLQYIFEDGSKRFCKNTSPKDGFFIIGDTTDNTIVYICEGYATGVSIYQAVNSKVVVSFSADNLSSVAATVLRELKPKKIVICADNDCYKTENIGMDKAREAAKSVNGIVVYPVFKDVSTLPTDFNDLASLEGVEAVRSCFINAATIKSYTMDEYEKREFEPSITLIDPWLENKTLNMIYSQPGVGKTWLCLHIAFALASGRNIPQLGWEIKKRCKTVYIDSELKGEKLQEYCAQVGGDDWSIETKKNFIVMDWETLVNCPIEADFFNEDWRKYFEKEIINFRKPDVIIIDNILALFGGNLNDRKDWDKVKKWFNFWTTRGITFLLVHHTGKYTGTYMGTQGIMASMSTALVLSKHEKIDDDEVYTTASFFLECTKDRYAKKKIHTYDVTIMTDREKNISVIQAQPASKSIKEQIIDVFNDGPIGDCKKMLDIINEGKAKKIDRQYIRKCLVSAHEDGLITRDIEPWEFFKIPKPKNN